MRTQNHPREGSWVFSEAEHVFPSIGCARLKRQYLTVVQNQISFDAGPANGWTNCFRCMGCGDKKYSV